MTGDDDFDRMFGRSPPARQPSPSLSPPPQGSFANRVGRSEPVRSEANETAVGSGPYKPYGYLPAANVGETCDVQRWVDGTETPEGIEFQYRFLMQIGYVGEETIKLFLPDCIVVISGRRLRDLRKRLARRQVTFIQQFSARVWPQPNADEPIIEAIAVMRPELHARS